MKKFKQTWRVWRAFIYYGVVVLVCCYFIFQQYKKAQNWPQTTGVILSVEERADQQAASMGGTLPTVKEILYEYHVGGERYVNDRVSYVSTLDQNAQHDLPEFAKGLEIPVFYNPAKPKESFLVRLDPHDYQWLHFIVFLHVVLVLIGGVQIGRSYFAK